MTHKEAVDWHKRTGRPIKCLEGFPKYNNIWVGTDGKGNPDLETLTDAERQILTDNASIAAILSL